MQPTRSGSSLNNNPAASPSGGLGSSVAGGSMAGSSLPSSSSQQQQQQPGTSPSGRLLGVKTGMGYCGICPTHGATGGSMNETEMDHTLCATHKLCIQEVMNRYYYFFDTQNVQGWLSLWSNEGEFCTSRTRGTTFSVATEFD